MNPLFSHSLQTIIPENHLKDQKNTDISHTSSVKTADGSESYSECHTPYSECNNMVSPLEYLGFTIKRILNLEACLRQAMANTKLFKNLKKISGGCRDVLLQLDEMKGFLKSETEIRIFSNQVRMLHAWNVLE